MGQLPCGFATATPALQKGRLPFTVLHFVWQSLFGSPATETAHGKSMVNPEFILSLSWVSWMFTSRCAFSKSPGESSFLTGAWWQIHGHKELDVTIDPGLAGIDHQELELMRSLADQWNKHTTAIRKKKRFPEPTVKSFEKDSVQVWKRIQITLITLACDCCRLKGIWDMSKY